MARYRVAGAHEVLGREPGEEFDADLNTVTEARLIWGGHIERLGAGGSVLSLRPAKTDEKADDAEHDADAAA